MDSEGGPESDNRTAIILMTYGSATTAEHVEEYMKRIYGAKASKSLIGDFQRRYRLVGHSPLIEITRRQAALLETRLGHRYIVRSAMRHSNPLISDVVAACSRDGADTITGIILSPQFSSYIMEGYKTALYDAAEMNGYAKSDVTIADPWPREAHFIQLLAKRVRHALHRLEILHGTRVPVIFTTHSLPERVVADDPTYLGQLRATRYAILAELDMPELESYAAYQSAGHSPEEWLKPDLVDILAILKDKGAPAVLIVPIQFLADHLEILYDLDRAAAEQCAENGIAYNRIELPNTDPLLIESLAAIAQRPQN